MTEQTLEQKVAESVAYIRQKTALQPKMALVLGSGLGALANELEDACIVEYQDIPHFSVSTAPGHAGRLLIGKLQGKTVLCMQGRIHYYEGNGIGQAVYPIRVMAKLGIEYLLLSNASGGINLSFQPGDLMMLVDHINFMGINPLIGPNEAAFGPRFNDMSYAYHPQMQAAIRQAAKEVGCDLKEGVYMACSGPSYETPAEIRAFRILGADAVGMSTVPEVIVGNHCGMKVGAISCITNMAAGILDQPLSEEEVLETGAKSGAIFCALVKSVVEKIG